MHGTADSTELPPGWQQCLDPASSDVYFWNTLTGETSWERPGDASVSVTSGGSSLLAASREEAGREAADAAAAEEHSENLGSGKLPAECRDSQQAAVENPLGEDGVPSMTIESTDATDGLDDDFAAAAAAAEEVVKAEHSARSALAAAGGVGRAGACA